MNKYDINVNNNEINTIISKIRYMGDKLIKLMKIVFQNFAISKGPSQLNKILYFT